MKALNKVFEGHEGIKVSSTKALTGHGYPCPDHGSCLLFACFIGWILPGSANVTEPDPGLGILNLIQKQNLLRLIVSFPTAVDSVEQTPV